MASKTLVTASIGIYRIGKTFFMQIITAEAYKFYAVELTQEQVVDLVLEEDLKGIILPSHPEGTTVLGRR